MEIKVRVDEIQKGHQQYVVIVDLHHINVQINITKTVTKLHTKRHFSLLFNHSVYSVSAFWLENVFQLQSWNIVTVLLLAYFSPNW